MPTQARTRLARRAVVDAARTLFLDRGYGATTIDAVSELAEVPIATVYRLFGSKLGILKALLDVSIAGDDEAVAVAERPEVRSLLAEPRPLDQLAGFVRLAARINQRTAALYRILVSAAAADADAAVLLEQLTRQRHDGQQRIVRSLAHARALAPGVRRRDAADLVHALVSPELFGLLVTDRGWPVERYQEWLTQTLADQLMAAEGAPR